MAGPTIHQFGAAIAAGSWDRIFDPNNAASADGNLVSPFDPYTIRALFTQATGSLFGDFYAFEQDINVQNMLRYLLRAGETLTSVYVEAAPFEMHSFGLGETIGHAQIRNLSSRGEYNRSESSIPGSITLSLMGDPTLMMNPVQPVTQVSAMRSGKQVTVSWTGNAPSYRVYRAASLDGDFEFVGETSNTTLVDPAAGAHQLYMVRAIKLIQSRSGSYFAGSTGVIAQSTSKLAPITPVRPSTPVSIRDAMRDLEEWLDEASAQHMHAHASSLDVA
jgi:hypothetical protein